MFYIVFTTHSDQSAYKDKPYPSIKKVTILNNTKQKTFYRFKIAVIKKINLCITKILIANRIVFQSFRNLLNNRILLYSHILIHIKLPHA